MRMKNSFFLKCFLAVVFIYTLDLCGIFIYIFELDYSHFYPNSINRNISELHHSGFTSTVRHYNITFIQKPIAKCGVIEDTIRLTFLIKSAISNSKRRNSIRRTWGYEKRFADVHIRRFFVLGATPDLDLMNSVKVEAKRHSDIVQADFIDDYYNNTIKTLMGMRWAKEHCPGSLYYMFVDDDYYVSTKNILRYLTQLSQNDVAPVFTGYALQTSPLRQKFSKWFITLQEYPFNLWPPYVTAGAFILSEKALQQLYAESFKARLFRFDDIYLGMLALRANITLTHCEFFYFHRPKYLGPQSFQYVLASHGFQDYDEMEKIWNDCRSSGFA